MRVTSSLSTLILFLLAWEAAIHVFQLPKYILPGPIDVTVALNKHVRVIYYESITTLTETLIGFFCGCIAGFIAGCGIAYHERLRRYFLPIILSSQSIPTFALSPLFIIWLGYGIYSKIAVTTLMIFFPVASSMYDGLKQTPNDWLILAKSTHASAWQRFYRIQLPSALPSLASGIRIAAVTAPIGAIAGEWVGSSHGLGYLMLNANARMDIDVLFASIVVLVTLTFTLFTCVDLLLKKSIWWAH